MFKLIYVCIFFFFRTDELEIISESFKIDSVVPSYVIGASDIENYDDSAVNIDSISEVIHENITETSGDFWYSKPVIVNLTTQQIFCQLSAENSGKSKNLIVFLQI